MTAPSGSAPDEITAAIRSLERRGFHRTASRLAAVWQMDDGTDGPECVRCGEIDRHARWCEHRPTAPSGSAPEPAERREWQIGDVIEMRSGPKWRRDRDETPQWVGPFGDRTSDQEMNRVASPAGGPDQSMRCTCDPWDQPALTPTCRVHGTLPVPAPTEPKENTVSDDETTEPGEAFDVLIWSPEPLSPEQKRRCRMVGLAQKGQALGWCPVCGMGDVPVKPYTKASGDVSLACTDERACAAATATRPPMPGERSPLWRSPTAEAEGRFRG